MWNQIYDVYVTDSYKLGTEDFCKQQNPAALQEITAVMHRDCPEGDVGGFGTTDQYHWQICIPIW